MGCILTRGAVAFALLGCTSTEPCSCASPPTSVLVYGEVRTAAGDLAALAVVRYELAPPAGGPSAPSLCELNPETSDADPAEVLTDAAGRFRTQVFSNYAPATRCLRVTAQAAGAGVESASIDGLLVPFRLSQPDSIGLILTLR